MSTSTYLFQGNERDYPYHYVGLIRGPKSKRSRGPFFYDAIRLNKDGLLDLDLKNQSTTQSKFFAEAAPCFTTHTIPFNVLQYVPALTGTMNMMVVHSTSPRLFHEFGTPPENQTITARIIDFPLITSSFDAIVHNMNGNEGVPEDKMRLMVALGFPGFIPSQGSAHFYGFYGDVISPLEWKLNVGLVEAVFENIDAFYQTKAPLVDNNGQEVDWKSGEVYMAYGWRVVGEIDSHQKIRTQPLYGSVTLTTWKKSSFNVYPDTFLKID